MALMTIINNDKANAGQVVALGQAVQLKVLHELSFNSYRNLVREVLLIILLLQMRKQGCVF
jgi:UDP-N-acetylenolpyruvoylglucosamine reductase